MCRHWTCCSSCLPSDGAVCPHCKGGERYAQSKAALESLLPVTNIHESRHCTVLYTTILQTP